MAEGELQLMNILVPDSWLREYLDTDATPEQIKEYLSLCGPSVEKISKFGQDYVYDVEITSNRIDTVSIFGFAREAAAILPKFGLKAKLKNIKPNNNLSLQANKLPLEITDPQKLCYRLLGIVMDEVALSASPKFIKDRLEMSNVRSLNNLIDITNYVMLEMGHPCHVFDYDRIKTGKLVLRYAKTGEKLITLDDKECILDNNDIVIDDGNGRIIDLPGIMGTKNSVVTQNTKRILVFIESNNPVAIRKTSIRLSLRSLAATINEKHPDAQLSKDTILRAIELYQEIASGKIASQLIDIYHKPSQPKAITTNNDFINDRIGIKIDKNEIIEILQSLHFKVSSDKKKFTIFSPSFRQFDVTIAEDIVEEVARIYGYHRLPSKLMTGKIPISAKENVFQIETMVKGALKYWGYTETYHYSFISKELIQKSQLEIKDHLKVANPLTSDFQYMRISLIPSLLTSIYNNQNFSGNLRLFESAMVYLPQKNNLPFEQPKINFVSYDDFLRLKGIILGLSQELGIKDIEEKPENLWHWGHPKQTLQLFSHGKVIGYLAKLHPQFSKKFQIRKDLYLAELDVNQLTNLYHPHKIYQPIPTYPPVIEDMAFAFTNKVLLGNFIKEIKNADQLIESVNLLDRHQNICTFRIIYLDRNQNLSSQKVKQLRNKVIKLVIQKFRVKLKE